MGYTCDACDAADASLYSVADAAVFCKGCSGRAGSQQGQHTVGHLPAQNELLALSRTSDRPSCDICQVRCVQRCRQGVSLTCILCVRDPAPATTRTHQDNKAMVFCAEDRALMCRGCDVMVHSANASVAKHARHLLTGWVVALHALGTDEAGSSADTATAAVGDAAPAMPRQTSAHEPTKRATNKGHPYRANGTAEYEDYDALRQLLGYPTPHAPTRKSSAKPPKAPTTRAAASSGSAGPSLHELTAGAGDDTAAAQGGGASTSQAPITLTAAELLGMPIADELSAKDIDAVFMPDMYTAFDDFDVDFSSLFAVPDFGPPSDDLDVGERKVCAFRLFAFLFYVSLCSSPQRIKPEPFSAGGDMELPPLPDTDDGLVPDVFNSDAKRLRV